MSFWRVNQNLSNSIGFLKGIAQPYQNPLVSEGAKAVPCPESDREIMRKFKIVRNVKIVSKVAKVTDK